MIRYSTTIWNPPTVVCVKLFHAVDVGGIGWLFEEMITSNAARIDPMPSVAMNEFTPSLTTMNELVQPMATATRIPAMIAGDHRPVAVVHQDDREDPGHVRRGPDRQVVEPGRERDEHGEADHPGDRLLGGDAVERRGRQELDRHPESEDDDEQGPQVEPAEAVEAGVELPAPRALRSLAR